MKGFLGIVLIFIIVSVISQMLGIGVGWTMLVITGLITVFFIVFLFWTRCQCKGDCICSKPPYEPSNFPPLCDPETMSRSEIQQQILLIEEYLKQGEAAIAGRFSERNLRGKFDGKVPWVYPEVRATLKAQLTKWIKKNEECATFLRAASTADASLLRRCETLLSHFESRQSFVSILP